MIARGLILKTRELLLKDMISFFIMYVFVSRKNIYINKFYLYKYFLEIRVFVCVYVNVFEKIHANVAPHQI